MPLQTQKTEEFFLKIFKVAILIFMALALVAVIVLGLNVVIQGTKSAREPAPAQKAPEKDVSLDDLKKFLLKDDANDAPAPESPPKSGAPTLSYLEDVTQLYRCSVEFGKKVGAETEAEDNAAAAQRVEALRAQIESFAKEGQRGQPWVKSLTTFTCSALADPAIIAMRKEGKVKSVFFPVLNFHMAAWDGIQSEKSRFEQAERDRVEKERMEEEQRIAEARANAVFSATAAGVAFGIFMLLALYLLGAKIESNLRGLDQSLAEIAQRQRTL